MSKCKYCGGSASEGFDACYRCMAEALEGRVRWRRKISVIDHVHRFEPPKLQWPNYEEIVAEHEKRRIAEYNPKPKRKVEFDVSWA